LRSGIGAKSAAPICARIACGRGTADTSQRRLAWLAALKMGDPMDPDLIERVARALFRRRMRPIETWDEAVARSWHYYGEPHADRNVREAIEDAKAAISAMCESPGPIYRVKQLPAGDRQGVASGTRALRAKPAKGVVSRTITVPRKPK